MGLELDEINAFRVVERALEKTSARPRIVHDNGSQFKSKEYRQLIKQFALEDIKAKVSDPESNGLIECFHRTLQEEGINCEVGKALQ